MKKTLILMVLAVMLALPVVAQAVPNVKDYPSLPAGQGKLTDKNSVPVNGAVTMTCAIYDAAIR